MMWLFSVIVCLEPMHTLGEDKQKFGICIWNTLDQGGLFLQGEVTLKTEWEERVITCYQENVYLIKNMVHYWRVGSCYILVYYGLKEV